MKENNVNQIDLFQYIDQKYLCAQNLSTENKEEFLEKIGFTRDDNGRLNFDHNKFATYLKACIHVVLLENGEMAIYNNKGYYETNIRLLLGQIIKLLLNQCYPLWCLNYENTSMEALRRDIRTQILRFETQNYINLKNGMLNVQSLQLLSHSYEFHSNIQIPIFYNKDAKCPQFLKFVDEISCHDEQLQTLIQEMIGYTLQSSSKAHKAFFLVGNGSNGKSVLADIIQHLVGLKNTSNVPLGSLGSSFGLGNLIGKQLNLSSENECGSVNAEIFKALTSGDRIDVNLKYCQSASHYLQAKLIFLFNNLPNTPDNSSGYYRRVVIIPFNRTFRGSEIKIDLTATLLTELDGILVWALEGLKRLSQNNFKFSTCEASQRCLDSYKSEQNPTGTFWDDCFVKSEGEKIKKAQYMIIIHFGALQIAMKVRITNRSFGYCSNQPLPNAKLKWM